MPINDKNIMSTYRRDICLEKGKGCYVWDSEGRRYLDLIGGIATCSIGHAHPDVVQALTDQTERIINASNLFFSRAQLQLAETLVRLSGLQRCFFSNSGAEAVEAALKLAKGCTGKDKIIAMKNSFHGRTLGSLSATWNPKYRKKFGKLVPGFVFVDYDDIAALEKELDANTAAVILEPVQGEAGVIIPHEGYLQKVERLCRQRQVLLILDEIQTGNGRTGRYFCYQHAAIRPDIVTLAKGLANGVPIGVTIANKKLDFEPGDHGSTFGGNSLACATALKTIEIIEQLLPDIAAKGDYWLSILHRIDAPIVKEVRGKGLMIAIELKEKNKNLGNRFAREGILVNCIADKIIRLLPPLPITLREIDLATVKIATILGALNHA